eukprot:749156-Amphidinium_carterae.1
MVMLVCFKAASWLSWPRVLLCIEDLKQILQDIAALEKEANEPLPVAPALPTPQEAQHMCVAQRVWPHRLHSDEKQRGDDVRSTCDNLI